MSSAAAPTFPVRRLSPAIVVWSVFAGMSLLVLFYVGRFGVNVPFWDEWCMVSVYSGATRCSLAWLWKPHNEHRIFLPRLIQVVLYAATHDLRSIMLANVLALTAATG